MTPSIAAPRWRHYLLEKAARRCSFMFGLTWSGYAQAQVVDDTLRMAADICFKSSGLWCGFELTMPAGTEGSSPHVAGCVRLPLASGRSWGPAQIDRAAAVLNSRAIGTQLQLGAAGGHVVVSRQVVLRGMEGGDEPSRELLRAQTDVVADMAQRLLSIGDDWWTIRANVEHAHQHE